MSLRNNNSTGKSSTISRADSDQKIVSYSRKIKISPSTITLTHHQADLENQFFEIMQQDMKDQAKSKRRLKRLSTNINTRTETLLQKNRITSQKTQQRVSLVGMSLNDKITPFIEKFHQVSERNLSPNKAQSSRTGLFDQQIIREEISSRMQQQEDKETEKSLSEVQNKPYIEKQSSKFQTQKSGQFKSRWNSLHVELIQKLSPLEIKHSKRLKEQLPVQNYTVFNKFLLEMADKDDIIELIQMFTKILKQVLEVKISELQIKEQYITLSQKLLRSALFCPNNLIPPKIRAELNVEKDYKNILESDMTLYSEITHQLLPLLLKAKKSLIFQSRRAQEEYNGKDETELELKMDLVDAKNAIKEKMEIIAELSQKPQELQKQIESLNQENALLKHQNSAMGEQLDRILKELAEAQSGMKSMKQENQELVATLNRTKQRNNRLEEENNKLAEEKANFKMKLEQMKSIYECSLARMLQCKQRIESLENRVHQLTEENRQLEPRAAITFIELTPRHPKLPSLIEELIEEDKQTEIIAKDSPRPFIQKFLREKEKEVPKITTNCFIQHLVKHVREVRNQVKKLKEVIAVMKKAKLAQSAQQFHKKQTRSASSSKQRPYTYRGGRTLNLEVNPSIDSTNQSVKSHLKSEKSYNPKSKFLIDDIDKLLQHQAEKRSVQGDKIYESGSFRIGIRTEEQLDNFEDLNSSSNLDSVKQDKKLL